MLDKEEKNFLEEIKRAVENVINKKFEKYNMDKAYYEFIFKVNILDDNFSKTQEIELINDEKEDIGFCQFCRASTFYYADKEYDGINGFVCPRCLKRYSCEKV